MKGIKEPSQNNNIEYSLVNYFVNKSNKTDSDQLSIIFEYDVIKKAPNKRRINCTAKN